MKDRAPRQRRRGKRPWLATAVSGALILSAAWLAWPSAPPTVTGIPRLVVDHETIDLGERRFSAPVRAAFTLTNAGTGSLRILETPRVMVAKGC